MKSNVTRYAESQSLKCFMLDAFGSDYADEHMKDNIITLSEFVCLMFNVHTFIRLLIAICTTSVDST